MLYSVVICFLGLSLLLYCLLAGADFGAGILEIFTGRKRRQDQIDLITEAMGPVWEANHMWLILAVVILFVGFPLAYTQASTYLHIPITLMLMGIILRGCAFTFRHYDAYHDRSQKLYSFIFAASSAFTPMTMGFIVGGLTLGRIDPEATDYYTGYIHPWWNLYSGSLALFICSLFTFLAAVYLIDETEDHELQQLFSRRALSANLATVFSGALVFLAAHYDQFPLIEKFIGDPFAMGAITVATLSLLPLWKSLRRGRSTVARFLAALQLTLILLAFFHIQYPVFMATTQGDLGFPDLAAPKATLRMLGYALAFGSCLLLPPLAYLMYVFKTRDSKQG